MDDITLPNQETIASPDELQAMIEAEEGPALIMYDDKAPTHNPSIGYGVNLRNTTNLALVLNQITYGGVNVFTRAAQYGLDTQDVVETIEDAIFEYPSQTYPTIGSLESALDNTLGGYFGLTSDQSAGLFSLTETQSQTVLQELIQGYTVGPYTAQPIYTLLSSYLTKNGVSAGNIPGANTSEALALASLFYNNPSLVGPGMIAALKAGNSAQAWYQIRYRSDANDPNGGIEKRRMYESAVFGMDGADSSLSQAEQDYEMLWEHRGM